MTADDMTDQEIERFVRLIHARYCRDMELPASVQGKRIVVETYLALERGQTVREGFLPWSPLYPVQPR